MKTHLLKKSLQGLLLLHLGFLLSCSDLSHADSESIIAGWANNGTESSSSAQLEGGSGVSSAVSSSSVDISSSSSSVQTTATGESSSSAVQNTFSSAVVRKAHECGFEATTASAGVLKCAEHEYATVKIGDQVWMAENLRFVTSTGSWCKSNTDYSSVADPSNTTVYCAHYGRLYDWATAMDLDVSYNAVLWNGETATRRGVCPIGWHLPSESDWTRLEENSGDASLAGNQLKSQNDWTPYAGISNTNRDGFNALPGGFLNETSLGSVGTQGHWWSTLENTAKYAAVRSLLYDQAVLKNNSFSKSYGFSVRCVQDAN